MVSKCSKILVKGLQLGLAAALITGAPILAAAESQPAAQAAQAPAPAAAPATPAAAPAEPGNAAIGKLLFTGEKRFTNGGPACMSCHSASVGELGGGILGPDLSKVYSEPSTNPLVNGAWINNPGTPIMGPIFSNKNVTDEEVDNLRAFFAQQSKVADASVEAPAPLPATGVVHGNIGSSQTGTFTVIGLGGFIGILIVFNIIWSGRYRNRNKGTAHEALWRNYGGKGGR